MRNLNLRAAIFAGSLIMAAGSAHAGGYKFTELQNINGAEVNGINNLGQAVGTIVDSVPMPTVWSSAGVASSASPSDSFVAWGNAINNAGTVAGGALNYSGDYSYTSPFAGSKSLYANYGTEGTAFGINDQGSVVGYAKFGATNGDAKGAMDLPNHAMLWNGSTRTDLAPAGSGTSVAMGINSSGVIVGTVDNMATVWVNDSVKYLGLGIANAVNTAGLIVGDSGQNAVLWDGSIETTLGLGSAKAINFNGQVVGSSNGHATLWSNGQIDLNNYFDPALKSAGWTLIDATGINDLGSITVNAYNSSSGAFTAFVLSAVPEPQSWSILLLGVALIVMVRSRKLSVRFNV